MSIKYPIITIVLFLLVSCDKEKNNACKLTGVTYSTTPAPTVFTATHNGNLITEFISANQRFKYTYNAAQQLVKSERYYTMQPYVSLKSEFIYDASGKLIERKNYEYLGDSLWLISRVVFHYSGNYRSQTDHYYLSNGIMEYRRKAVYTWTGDNVASISQYDPPSSLACITTFMHDLNKENPFSSQFKIFYLQELYDDDLTHAYFLSKNPISSSSSQCPTAKTDTWTYNYNSQGLPTTVIVNENGTTPFTMWTFAYSCV